MIEWDNFRRYASWMLRLNLDPDSIVPEGVPHMISVNSPNGIMYPGLRELIWAAQLHTPPFYRLFLSPNLVELALVSPSLKDEVPGEVLSARSISDPGTGNFPASAFKP